jgi:type IV pilus assembly protein PilB
MARQKLGEILLAAGVIRQDHLEIGLREQQRWGGQLGHILVEKRFIDERTLLAALSQQLRIPVVDLDEHPMLQDVVDLVPLELAQEHTLIPFRRQGKFLDVAMGNPLDIGITDELRIRTQLNVRPHLASPDAIQAAIRQRYGGGARQQKPISMPVGVVDQVDDDPVAVRSLQERVAHLEALVARDEDVIRKLLRLLIEKQVVTRDEILAAIG